MRRAVHHVRARREARGRGRWRTGAVRGEAGMVTAELAVTMPALVLVLVLVLSGVSAGVTQLRVTDAARVAARAAAVGQGDLAGLASQAAGPVELSVSGVGELTCVEVSRAVPGPLGAAGLRARSRACAWTEPGAAEAGGSW